MKFLAWTYTEWLLVAAVFLGVIVAEKLLDSAAGSSSPNDRLLHAVGTRDPEAVAAALSGGASATTRDQLGVPALIYAAGTCDAGLVSQLIAAGADVNASDARGVTPLMMAAQFDRDDIARLILAAGADPTRRTAGGNTARDVADLNHSVRVLMLLSDGSAFAP